MPPPLTAGRDERQLRNKLWRVFGFPCLYFVVLTLKRQDVIAITLTRATGHPSPAGEGFNILLAALKFKRQYQRRVRTIFILKAGPILAFQKSPKLICNFSLDRNNRKEYSFDMELKPVAKKFVLHWGEMGSTWGVNRTVAQIHALLFITGRPLNADEITETLDVARSNVSMSLKELSNWNLIRSVPLMGDRRDHYETTTDVWELFRTVVRERKSREFDPTIEVLRDCLKSGDIASEDKAAQMRIKETLALMEALSSWASEMIRLEPSTMMKVIKLGAKVQHLVHGKPSASANSSATKLENARHSVKAAE